MMGDVRKVVKTNRGVTLDGQTVTVTDSKGRVIEGDLPLNEWLTLTIAGTVTPRPWWRRWLARLRFAA